jgi:hypothetical protein
MIGIVLNRLIEIDAERTVSGVRVKMIFELRGSDFEYQFLLEYDLAVINHVLELRTLFDQQRAALNADSHSAWDEAVTAFYAHE